MIPFTAYSEEQRSKIIECVMAKQSKVGEEYELQTEERHFNAIVDELEVHARQYVNDISKRSAVSKKHLKSVATLCAKLADLLPHFNASPELLGLGLPPINDNEKAQFMRQYNDFASFFSVRHEFEEWPTRAFGFDGYANTKSQQL